MLESMNSSFGFLRLEILEEKLNRKIYDLFRAEFATTVLNTYL